MPRTIRKKSYSLCIIGNSHVAAIKQAWTNRAPAVASDFSLTFFSAQNKYMARLKLEGRVLVPDSEFLERKLSFTSDGISRIEVDSYDVFVFIGSGFCVDVEKICDDGSTIAGLKFGLKNLVSRACFAAVVEARLRETLLVELVEKVSALSKAPVLLATAPYLSENALGDDTLRDDPRFRDHEFLTEIVAIGRAAAQRVAAQLGAEIIWQDDSTVGIPGFTKAEFGLNPVRFAMRGGKSPVTDRRHGNEDYGFLVLMKILRRLDELSGGRVLVDAHQRKRIVAI
jgi:hypothetical protein